MARRREKGSLWTKRNIIGGLVALGILGGAIYTYVISQNSTSDTGEVIYQTAEAKKGTLSSSTLLSGTVKAQSEQYVYFDPSKGSSATVTVAVGDKVNVGQQLVQYDKTTAQAAYDEAVRNRDKIGRDINQLTTYGQSAPSDTANSADVADAATGMTGGDATEGMPSSGVQNSAQADAEYQNQLQSLYDAYATAEDQVAKAQTALNDTIFLSDVEGTVVEIHQDIDPSAKESQVLVHVTSEGKLQVEGTLTEYDLANIKEGQAIKIKSKVYPDKEWAGKITHISNYPSQDSTASAASAAGAGSSTGATYPYKAEITGDLGELKQGFSVSVEVVNEKQSLLVPLSAIVSDDDKSYVWVLDNDSKKISKVEVTLGNADAVSQEITGGLKENQTLVATPDDSLKDGQKLDETQPLADTGGVADE